MKRFELAGAALLFATLAAPSYAVPTTAPAEVSAEAQLETMFDQVMDEMFAPGEVDRDWQKGGSDIRAAVLAKPGGAQKNFVVTTDKDGDATITLLSSDGAKAVPGSWKLVDQHGDLDRASDDLIVSVGRLDGRFFFVGRETSKLTGSAFCSAELLGVQLFEDRADPTEGDIDPAMIKVLFEAVVKRLNNRPFCMRFDAKGESYSVRNFLPDGRRLPAMDAFNETAVIVPAAPWPQLLKKAD